MFANIKNNKQNTFKNQGKFYSKNKINEDEIIGKVLVGKDVNKDLEVAEFCTFETMEKEITEIADEIEEKSENKEKKNTVKKILSFLF